jgi:hypothetical protein
VHQRVRLGQAGLVPDEMLGAGLVLLVFRV